MMRLTTKNDKKALILAAASQVFGENGFHAATVEAIAQQAGVGKGTIYQYFGSKMEIFKELHHWYLESYLTSMDDALDDQASFETNLTNLIAVHVDNMENIAGMFRKLLPDVSCMSMSLEEVAQTNEMIDKRMNRIKMLVVNAIANGEVRNAKVDVVMHFIVGMLTGTMHSIIEGQQFQAEDATYLKYELAEIILRGITK